MKKFSKILCAVLVIAVLCSSLIFLVGAEEGSSATSNLLDGFTSVSMTKDDGAALLEAIKYSAGDNLLNGAGISDNNATDDIAWGSEGGRGSDLITHTASGNVIYKEYLVGNPEGKYANGYQKDGNDYVNYGFAKVDLTKEDGYNKYIVVDFDFAYEGATDGLAFQVITRGNGAYWATTMQLRNLGVPADNFVHVTAVYDYASGDAHMFVNGKFVQTVDNGALTDTGSADYEAGVEMGASEFRVGSNSSMTVYLDNLYIRSQKNAADSDVLGDALASGTITGWSGNIYSAEYTLPLLPYFVPSLNVVDFASNSITNSGVFVAGSTGNNVTYVATGNASDSPFISIGSAGVDPYIVAYCNTTTSYKGAANNIFLNANVPNTDPFTVIGEDAKGYYVIDFDIASHGHMLPAIDVSVVMRRASDTAGFPFSDEIYLDGYVTETNAWSHITIVGDIANNVAHIYVNGVYAGNGGKAVRNDTADSNKLGANDTQVVAQGFRVEITRNNIQTDMTAGDNAIFDNFSHRLYIENGDALTAALADGNITDWADHDAGRAGEALPVIAKVNGTEYRNTNVLQTALTSNETLNVEFLGKPIVPVLLHANCAINTYGMPIEDLVKLDDGCEVISTDGNIVTIKAPYAANETLAKADKTAVLNLIKSGVEGNLLSATTVISEYYRTDGKGRTHYIVTNTVTGEQYIRDTVDVNAPLATNNVYMDWKTDAPNNRVDYELGVDQFIVFDIDFALHTIGEKYAISSDMQVTSDINLNVVTRNSTDGGVWGNNAGEYIKFFSQAGVKNGEFVHLTAVISPDTRKMDVFINGEHVATIENAISAAEGNNFSSIRMFSSSTSTADYHNVALRAVKSSELTAAVSAKDITQWSGNVYTADYKLPSIAPIATVNGVEYTVASRLAEALVGNDKAEVELLHSFSEEIVVSRPSVINTNGLAHNFVTCEEGTVTADGDVLTFTSPYRSNDLVITEGLTSSTVDKSHAIFNAVYYPADDNVFAKIVHQTYQEANKRHAYLVTNPDNGQTYIYDTYDGDPAGQNTYLNWHFGGDVATKGKGYTLGVNQYLVMDFDLAFDEYANTNVNITTRDSANTNIAGTGFHLNEAMIKAGVSAGHFAHITILAEVDTNTVYVYVNGEKQLTVSNGISKLALESGYWLDGVRALQNLATSIKYDNMYMRVVEDATLAGLNSLAGHSINVYTNDYTLPTLPKLATIDGVDCYSADDVSAVLYGNIETPKQVEFFHSTSAIINVSCHAVLNTHGLDLNFKYYNGKVTDLGDGVYSFACGYVSDTVIENVTATSTFTSAVNVSGNDNIITNIHFDKTGTWMNTGWLDENGNSVSGVHTYLVSNKNMDNVYGMFALPEGSSGLIGDKTYKMVDGVLTEGGQSGTYVNLQFNSANNAHYFTYSASENNYWVYDFDVLIEGDSLDMYPYNLIKTADGGFQYGTFDVKLADLYREHGNDSVFNHFTIVADYNNNAQYIFVNGAYVSTSPLMTSNVPETAYVEGNQYYNLGLRISLGTKTYDDDDSFAFDNTLARKFVTSNAGNLVEAIASGDITTWTKSYYTASYEVPTTPTLAVVDGVEYNNVAAVENAVENGQGTVNVSIVRPLYGGLELAGNAVVQTNKFTDKITVAQVTGHEIDTKEDWMGQNGIVKASGKYILTVDGTVYTVETLTADNWAENSMLVTWYTTPDSYETWEDVLYIYGHQILPPSMTGAYIQNGKLIDAAWYVDGDADKNVVTEFPVASVELGTLNYACTLDESDCDFAATGLMSGLKVNADFTLSLYVPVTDKLLTTGTVENIDGVDYLVLTSNIVANRVANTVTFQFNVVDGEGNAYVQYETLSILDYAKNLLADNEVEIYDKNLMMAALAYVNEAYVILSGKASEPVSEVLNTYADYAPETAELGEVYTTSGMSSVIRSAAMKLDAAPALAFKVAMGFKGEIKFTYTSLGEEVVVIKTVDATKGEQLVVLDSFKVYDINETVAIEIICDGGEVITGSYNLSTYANGLENPAFVAALATYSDIAKAHKLAELEAAAPKTYTVTVDGAVVGTYDEGSKIAAPEYTPVDGYKAVWTVDGVAWDFENDVITSDITLVLAGEVLDITVKDAADVQSTTLTTINAGKIKQFDQSNLDDGSNSNKNGYFLKEGGTPVYVDAVMKGETVEALYFSRSYDWTTYATADQNSGFSETRWVISNNVVSITFNYLINGTVADYAGASTGTDLAGNTATLPSAFVQLNTSAIEGAAGDKYPEIMDEDKLLIANGEWNTFTITFDEPLATSINFLLKLYNFEGEILVANIDVQYAD